MKKLLILSFLLLNAANAYELDISQAHVGKSSIVNEKECYLLISPDILSKKTKYFISIDSSANYFVLFEENSFTDTTDSIFYLLKNHSEKLFIQFNKYNGKPVYFSHSDTSGNKICIFH